MNGLGWLFAMFFLIIAAAALAAKVSRAFNPVIINPAFTPPQPCNNPPRMALNPNWKNWIDAQTNIPKSLKLQMKLIPASALPNYAP